MITRPRIGQLNTTISVQRRGRAVSDGGGGYTQGAFRTFLASIRARVIPLKGGEEVLANRLTSTALFEVQVRSCSETRGITADDQVTLRDGRVLNVTDVENYDEHNRFLTLTCKSGVAT